jgi:hypothetical protein
MTARHLLSVFVIVALAVALPVAMLEAADPAATCKEKKAKFSGKYSLDLLKAFGKNKKKKNVAKLTSDISRAVSKIDKGFTKAEFDGQGQPRGCLTTGDVGDIKTTTNLHALAVLDLLCPTSSTTTTTNTTGTTAIPTTSTPTTTVTTTTLLDCICPTGSVPVAPTAICCFPQEFPATGQTTSYTADKNDGVGGAVAVNDDGAQQEGAALQYVDNGDGTITDLNTGLMWEKKGDDGGLHAWNNTYRWSGNGSQETIWDWIDDVNAEGGTGFAGYNDWRIPNIKELQSLLDLESPDVTPAIDAVFHTNCTPGCANTDCSCTCSLTEPACGASDTWSSSTVDAANAWRQGYSLGQTASHPKTSAFFVRAVRTQPVCLEIFPATGQTTSYTADKNDGVVGAVAVYDDGAQQAGAALQYVDNGDGTVTDLNTGLMWEKKGDDGGLHAWNNTYRWSGDGNQETIWDWIDDVNAEGGTGFAGYNDWRIPNSKELRSLLDLESPDVTPAIDAVFHTNCTPGCANTDCSCTCSLTEPACGASDTWSSSTVDAANAWRQGYSVGQTTSHAKTNAYYVRAVRTPTP